MVPRPESAKNLEAFRMRYDTLLEPGILTCSHNM